MISDQGGCVVLMALVREVSRKKDECRLRTEAQSVEDRVLLLLLFFFFFIVCFI